MIEDDGPTCAATQACCNAGAATCRWPAGAPEALAAQPSQARAPQLVLLDVHLGAGLHGPEVFAQLCQRWGQSPP